jgi:hypothetical protein
MSAVNDQLRANLGVMRVAIVDDDIVLPNVTTQAGARPVLGTCRVTSAPANASMILRRSEEAPFPFVWVINDSAQPIVVFGAVGEKHGGATNGSLTIPAGQAGQFQHVPRSNPALGQDWRSAVLS